MDKSISKTEFHRGMKAVEKGEGGGPPSVDGVKKNPEDEYGLKTLGC